MADFLDEKRREISERLRELKPLVDEYHRLEAAQAALEGVNPRGATRRAPARGRAALELVRTRPGITIPQMAEAMGIKQNYLYRVLPSLQKDGLVRKEGRGWHARDAA